MKDRLIEIVEAQTDPLRRLNIGREYLQEYILYVNFIKGFNENLIFEGGTALRILHGLKRFSEVLDFSLLKTMDFQLLKEALITELFLAGYKIEVAKRQRGSLYRLIVKFVGLDELFMLPRGKKLVISLEFDVNPPSGGRIEKSITGREVLFWVKHYDLPSLFAKKLHAVLFREHVKGRDFYDLLWYLTRKPPISPNEELFFNAVIQTHPKEYEAVKEMGWKNALKKKLLEVNFARIREDVAPFLENSGEINLLTKETFLEILAREV